MTSYSFLTTWILDAPREAVWDAIYEIERWPDWWRGVKRVQSSSREAETAVWVRSIAMSGAA